MDIRLETSMGWYCLILYTVLALGLCQDFMFPPYGDGPYPVLDATPEEVTVKNGSRAILPCHVLNGDTIEVMWHYGGFDEVISNDTYIQVKDSRFSVDKTQNGDVKLVIENVQLKDAGLYQCMIPMIPPQYKSVTLTVLAKPSINISALLPVYSIVEGESLSVTCLASGYPFPEIKWYKDTTDSANSENKKELLSSNQTLYIERIQYGDGNIYGCTARNEFGSAMYEIFVDILYKPRLNVPSSSYSVKKNSEIILVCIVDSNPTPTLYWYRNGKQLHTKWKYFVQELENVQSEFKKTFQLTIRFTSAKDAGVYVCKAKNRIGSAETSISLLIQETTSTSSTTTTSRATTTTTTMTTPTTTTSTTTTSTITIEPEANTVQKTTPLSIEEPRTGGSRSNGATTTTNKQHTTAYIVSFVTFMIVLLL